MAKGNQYYIIEAAVLPEVFLKVAQAKQLLVTGEVATVNEATKRMNISRSAFYKYRDSILTFQDLTGGRRITFQFTLYDLPGLLSTILAIFAEREVNILTLNTTIPTNGCALATITVEILDINLSLEDLLRDLRLIEGVVKAEIVGG